MVTKERIFLLLRDIRSIIYDDDDGFIIGVKNARVSFSFALHILCIHIYIHTYTLRGMHTGTIGISRKWLCTLCAFYARRVASQSTHPRRLASASSSFWFVDGDRGCSSAGVDARGVVLAFDVVGIIAVETRRRRSLMKPSSDVFIIIFFFFFVVVVVSDARRRRATAARRGPVVVEGSVDGGVVRIVQSSFFVERKIFFPFVPLNYFPVPRFNIIVVVVVIIIIIIITSYTERRRRRRRGGGPS